MTIEEEIKGIDFSVSDRDVWELWVKNNQDGYGSGVIRFAERWARLMQVRMKDGDISSVANKASHDADTDGITGFMYGVAVSVLSSCWSHGEELRKWHNISTQIGNEGEKANESGGVLNPALFNIQK